MRLIDADALIESIENVCCKPCKELKRDYNGVRCRSCQYGDEIDDIDSFHTAEQPHWIPCSERLPEITKHHTSEPCIVYCENGAYGFAELEENIFGQVGWNCERDDEYHEPLGEVLAWMPLPESYKGE